MNELDAILGAWRAEPEAAQGAVLATVVHVRGSAYRRPGARMLILPDGRRIGSISGGCLEGDVSKKAWWFTEGGEPSVRVYDTSSDDDAVWEFGLGCNGAVHVLLERVSHARTAETLRFLARNRAARRASVVATVVGNSLSAPTRPGARLLFDEDGIRGGVLAGSPLEGAVLRHVRDSYLHQRSHLAHLESCDVFVEWIGPPVPVVIFGAGHDAIPLAIVAKELGWHVTVADGRANYAKAARFPAADRVALIRPEDPLAGLGVGRDTAVVVMTHNYRQDVHLLRHILPARPRYLGLLGPRSRAEDLLHEVNLPVNGVDVHAPAGLDLGAGTPEAIALSIVAEIQASLEGRAGGMLKQREGPIHDAVLESGRAPERMAAATEARTCELV